MKELNPLFILLLSLVVLGFTLIKAARWSREKNKQLRKTADSTRERIIENMRIYGVTKESLVRYYCSSTTKTEEMLGKFLASMVIILLVVFMSFGMYLLFSRI